MRHAIALLLLTSTPALAADWPGVDDPTPWGSLATGVEIQDLEVGTGAAVEVGAVASVLYTGLLGDGTVFDSNVESGQPLAFRVGAHQVIPGWEDGLVGMKVGGRRRLVIPAAEGYGARGIGPIPPNSVLYFEVKLLSVEAPRKSPAAPTPVDEEAWRTLEGDIRVGELLRGDGARARHGHRVCVDYAVFQGGACTEHTYTRERCTWYRLDDDDLPPALDLGIVKMRVGGTRQVVAADGTVYEVQLVDTGK